MSALFDRKNRTIFVFFIALFLSYAGELKIVTYNLLNFPENYGYQRLKYFRQIMDYVKPDLLVVQEMQSEQGMILFRDSVLNHAKNDFSFAPFNDGPDTDNGIFYRRTKVSVIDALYIPTINRDIARYRIRISDSNRDFYIFSVHLKSGTDCEYIRLQEARILRRHLDSLEMNADYLVMGDFNFYHNESGYCLLVDSVEHSQKGLRDPLNIPFVWHDNRKYSYVHTQSTRTEKLPDNGADGGLDDRFDLVLCSPGFLDTAGLFLPVESYMVFGNDGNHFDRSINSGINYAVPAEIANALYYASDHLPVCVHIVDCYQTPTEAGELIVLPNPVQRQAQIKLPYFEDFQNAKITITNILGRRVYEMETLNPNSIIISSDKFDIGIYFVCVQVRTKYNVRHYQAKIAIVK